MCTQSGFKHLKILSVTRQTNFSGKAVLYSADRSSILKFLMRIAKLGSWYNVGKGLETDVDPCYMSGDIIIYFEHHSSAFMEVRAGTG